MLALFPFPMTPQKERQAIFEKGANTMRLMLADWRGGGGNEPAHVPSGTCGLRCERGQVPNFHSEIQTAADDLFSVGAE